MHIGNGVTGFPSSTNDARLAIIGQQRGTGVAMLGITESKKLFVLFANPYAGATLSTMWTQIT